METLEELLPGELKIYQKKKGVRFGMDAVLLSAFVKVMRGENVLEIGAGCGVIALLLAYVKGAHVSAVEIQKDYADMARRSMALNALQERVEVIEGDIRNLQFRQAPFDVIVANPPYYPVQSGYFHSIERMGAYSELHLSLDELFEAIARLLRTEGRWYLIYPASREEELLKAMKKMNMRLKSLKYVCANGSSPPVRILVEGERGAGGKAEISRMYLRDEMGESEELKRLYRSLGYGKEER